MSKDGESSAAKNTDIDNNQDLNGIVDRFNFASIDEFLAYVGYCQTHKELSSHGVEWQKGDSYMNLYQRAYQSTEEGRYTECIALCKEALQYNPVGYKARFEMIHAYMRLGDMNSAKKYLNVLSEYLIDAEMIALYYRDYGYIAYEEENFEESFACYLKSQIFAESKIADEELVNIIKQHPEVVKINCVSVLDDVLIKNHIRVYNPDNK